MTNTGWSYFLFLSAQGIYLWSESLYKIGGEQCPHSKSDKNYCEGSCNAERNFTFHNFFSDLSQTEEFDIKRLIVVGTVRKNKAYLPQEFSDQKKRTVESSSDSTRTRLLPLSSPNETNSSYSCQPCIMTQKNGYCALLQQQLKTCGYCALWTNLVTLTVHKVGKMMASVMLNENV